MTSTGSSELGARCLVVLPLPAEITLETQYSEVNLSALHWMLVYCGSWVQMSQLVFRAEYVEL